MLISILTILQFDPTIFDGVNFPDGVIKTTAIDTICATCAEISVIYSDPAVLKNLLRNWSERNAYRWKTLYNTTNKEYNPIENYDRNEEWKDTAKGLEKVKGFESGNLTDSSSGESSSGHAGRVHGNVGVTTTQAMLAEERAVANFSIYDTIANDFKQEFCVMVW